MTTSWPYPAYAAAGQGAYLKGSRPLIEPPTHWEDDKPANPYWLRNFVTRDEQIDRKWELVQELEASGYSTEEAIRKAREVFPVWPRS